MSPAGPRLLETRRCLRLSAHLWLDGLSERRGDSPEGERSQPPYPNRASMCRGSVPLRTGAAGHRAHPFGPLLDTSVGVRAKTLCYKEAGRPASLQGLFMEHSGSALERERLGLQEDGAGMAGDQTSYGSAPPGRTLSEVQVLPKPDIFARYFFKTSCSGSP